FVSITGDRTTNSYVSVQTPEGTWGCTGPTGLTAGCAPNNDEGQDTSCSNGNNNSHTNACFGIEAQVDTGGVPVSPPYWSLYLGKVQVQDLSVTPTTAFTAANELWKAAAAMGSMMSVVTMYSSIRAYQEPDPLRRRMKLMVAVVFAIGAGTLAVFAIILSHL